ncbi:MAG: hypothetical protein ACLPR9_18865 [Acidimicrobiales bacterium]
MVTVPIAGGLTDTAQASTTSPQIAGSVAAPSAADVSPICDAPDASTTLGPAPSLPSDPTSTVVTPTGGVYDFTVTSSGIYVYTGSMLDTYTLSGSPNGSFAVPAQFGSGDEVSQPVVDSSGNIYLSSYYGKLVDKFSPLGTVLWSVDPQSGNPTGLFGVGSGSAFQLVVSVVQNKTSSTLLNPSTGAASGSSALVDDFDYVTQESNGNLLFSGNGYVRPWIPPVPRSSPPSAPPTLRGRTSTPGRGPSSTIRPRPCRGRMGRSTRPTRSTPSRARAPRATSRALLTSAET